MTASKMFDVVLGIDIHVVITPAGVPLPIPHPFTGFTLDLMAYLPIIGSTTYVNGSLGAQAGTEGRTVPFTHFPIGGVFVPPPTNDCEIFMGSATVIVDGAPQSRTGMPVLSCSTLGMITPPRAGKKPNVGFYLPTSVILSPPWGMPVMVGGPPTIDMVAMAFKGLMALGGKMFRKFVVNKKWYKKACEKVHEMASKVTKKLPENLRNKVHRALCDKIGHPVDVATGKVFTEITDFSLPGPIPLEWERVWYSTSAYEGALGHGWHHKYDLQLGMTENGNTLHLRLADGRNAYLPLLMEGEEVFLRQEQLTLRREADWYILMDSDYLEYYFSAADVNPHRSSNLHRILRAGAQISFAYDREGGLKEIIDSGGRTLKVTTDDAQRITIIEAPHPGVQQAGSYFPIVRYSYDGIGNLTRSHDAIDHYYAYEYERHLLVRETNRNGLSFYFEYDGEGYDAWCIRTWGDEGIHDNTLRFDKENGTTTVLNSLGHQTIYHWNSDGLVWKTIDPLGGEAIWQYDAAGKMLREIDEIGRVTSYQYDALGNMTVIDYPDGSAIKMHYDEFSMVNAVDQNGGTWSWEHDEEHRIAAETDCTGSTIAYQYDGPFLREYTDASQRSTKIEYDQWGNLSRIVDPGGNVRTWRHDALGRVTQNSDAAGMPQVISRDLTGRITQILFPDNRQVRYKYDAEGNLVNKRVPTGETTFSYKDFNRLSSREENGRRIEYKYNTEGKITSLINESGHVYQFEHNAKGQVIAEMGFDGLLRRYHRDGAGQIQRVVRPAGRFTEYERDAVGRVVKKTFSSGETEAFDYRADGAMIRAANETCDLRFELDEMGRVVQEKQGKVILTSTYDDSGNRTLLESSVGTRIEATFGEFNDVNSIDVQLASGGHWSTTFDRTDTGLVREQVLPGGVVSQWKREKLGRPLQHQIRQGGRRLRQRSYAWTLNQSIASITDSETGARSFKYDVEGRLAEVAYPDGNKEAVHRDITGNLYGNVGETDRKYGPAGQLLVHGSHRFKYDEEGNLAVKICSNGERWTYEWTDSGRLSAVTQPSGEVVQFAYDALGRRISKQYRGTTTRWVWDGNNVLHEWEEKTKGFGKNATLSPGLVDPSESEENRNSSLSVTMAGFSSQPKQEGINITTWVFSPSGFTPLAKLTAQEEISIISDHLGTPICAVDAQGSERWSLDMRLNGEEKHVEGWRDVCPFRFPGQYADQETGLYYNRFRYYDASTGSYISQDPIRHHGNNPTFYAYPDNATLSCDPFGLDGQFTIYSHLDGDGDKIGHAFIGITENGSTRHLGQWPANGFTQSDLPALFTTGIPGAIDPNDTRYINPDKGFTVSRTYDVTDEQLRKLDDYIKDFDAGNAAGKNGYNLRSRQCASFAYGAARSMGIKDLKLPWYKWVTPRSLMDKLKCLNNPGTCQ